MRRFRSIFDWHCDVPAAVSRSCLLHLHRLLQRHPQSSSPEIPAGYRDWKLISVAHEEANLNSFAAVMGNDVAIEAYRDGTLPFP